MGFLILPLVIGVMALPSPTPTGLADFTRLRDAVHDEVYVTDQTGQERRLTIIEAGETAVTAQIGFQSMQMSRDAIVSVDRARDGNVDGFVKGALIGLLLVQESREPKAERRDPEAERPAPKAGSLQLQHQPVGDDLRADIPFERLERLVDGGIGTHASIVSERATQLFQLRLEIGIGQRAAIGPGRDDPEIAQQ